MERRGLAAAAPDRRRDHLAAAHGRADRARVQPARPCTCSTPRASSASSPTCSTPAGSDRARQREPRGAGAAARAARRRRSAGRCCRSRRARENGEQLALRRPGGAGVHRRASGRAVDLDDAARPTSTGSSSSTRGSCKGKFPAILEQPAARELYDDATALLDEIVAGEAAAGRAACYGFWPAWRRGRRRRARRRMRFPMLRQQSAIRRLAAEPLPRRLRRARGRPPRRLRGRRSTAPTSSPPATRPSTTTTARSWSRRSPTGSPRRSPSTCTSRRGASGTSRASGSRTRS